MWSKSTCFAHASQVHVTVIPGRTAMTTPSTQPENRWTERAFVVQVDRIVDGRNRLHGRGEQVASGEATHCPETSS
jgi:hypothetical protein